MIAVTGATGELGKRVLESLRKTHPASSLVALARDPSKAADLSDQGIIVQKADYNDQESYEKALQDVEKLLLISSNDIGNRTAQHERVIRAAEKAGVRLIVYTSILKADTPPMALATEHQETESLLAASPLNCVVLRNGWYNENYTGTIAGAVAQGAVAGASGEGRISAASRRDYADAAAAVLTSTEDLSGRIFELGGDAAITGPSLAAEIARHAGCAVSYTHLSQTDYENVLTDVGVPAGFATLLADADAHAANDALFDGSKTLSGLIGRPTTPIGQTIAETLAG